MTLRVQLVVNCFQNCILAYNSQHTAIQTFDMLVVKELYRNQKEERIYTESRLASLFCCPSALKQL